MGSEPEKSNLTLPAEGFEIVILVPLCQLRVCWLEVFVPFAWKVAPPPPPPVIVQSVRETPALPAQVTPEPRKFKLWRSVTGTPTLSTVVSACARSTVGTALAGVAA